MKIITIDDVKIESPDDISFELSLRSKLREKYNHSTIVALGFIEMDRIDEFLNTEIGPKESNWDNLWYYKTDYDFGFCEYFFSVLKALINSTRPLLSQNQSS